ncbi:CBASS oligonucleotide cyclase [Halobium salinum]|uniref:CBASS oligonucleotide cyclase n=1 Tax=Halobium salinum TaxID=1364940 RepID=A0ABD5PEK8_9EURY|nr:CBASS oligonucleotide cyclase [Halobium salinum]
MGGGYRTSMTQQSHAGRAPVETPEVDRTLDQILSTENEVEDCYENYAEGSKITDRQGERISDRRDRLVNILEESMEVEDSRLIGSFTRDTMVGPLNQDSDADIMVVLDADRHREWIHQENGPRNCLNAVMRQIQNDPRFSDTEVRVRRNVVQVRYHDSTIEIAPAFDYSKVPQAKHPKQDGWNLFNDASDGYAIPDTHGKQSWQGTNPRRYKQMFEVRDEANNGRVSGLTRTMKKWSENNDVPVRSYHMEIMVYNYFAEKSRTGEPVPSSYESLTRDFVNTLPSRVKNTTREPVYDEAVDSGTSREQKDRVAKKAKSAAEKLKRAKQLKKQGETEKAKELLREVHGEGFN